MSHCPQLTGTDRSGSEDGVSRQYEGGSETLKAGDKRNGFLKTHEGIAISTNNTNPDLPRSARTGEFSTEIPFLATSEGQCEILFKENYRVLTR